MTRPEPNKMTESELEVVGHSLGINVYHAKRSKKKSDKKLPKEFYRNRFCASESHSDYTTISRLVSAGIMGAGAKINDGRDTMYFVTEAGIKAFREQFKQFVEL